ncbi:hypothetical protein RRG08_063780 [Elysia crispata]|uniref:Uncharacterized protein n=1 Tax=Elysia crispata TaxID=231223 RepID=A0AAE1AJF9_9GAST|nr:hypothetical protein RRG08_063780 [Elysia crispata]
MHVPIELNPPLQEGGNVCLHDYPEYEELFSDAGRTDALAAASGLGADCLDHCEISIEMCDHSLNARVDT